MTRDARPLSDAEVSRLTLFTVAHAGPDGVTREEMDRVYAWAVEARLDAVLLAKVLAGEVVASVREDGEVCFRLRPPDVQLDADLEAALAKLGDER